MVKQIAVYLANNVPYCEVGIRQELLQCLQGIAKELGISAEEFARMIE
jgi:hypothetical protein